MPLNGDILIIMQHSRGWGMFTLDTFLYVQSTGLIKHLFCHQLSDGSFITSTIKSFAKKDYKFG